MAFFGMEDILAAGRYPNISSDIEPAYAGMGSRDALIPLHSHGSSHTAYRKLLDPLAAGWHRCLGSHLARLELRTAVDQLHRRIPSYTVTPGETPEYHHAGVRAATYLPLSFPL